METIRAVITYSLTREHTEKRPTDGQVYRSEESLVSTSREVSEEATKIPSFLQIRN